MVYVRNPVARGCAQTSVNPEWAQQNLGMKTVGKVALYHFYYHPRQFPTLATRYWSILPRYYVELMRLHWRAIPGGVSFPIPALIAVGEERIHLDHSVALLNEQIGGVVYGINKVALMRVAALLSSDYPTPRSQPPASR